MTWGEYKAAVELDVDDSFEIVGIEWWSPPWCGHGEETNRRMGVRYVNPRNVDDETEQAECTKPSTT